MEITTMLVLASLAGVASVLLRARTTAVVVASARHGVTFPCEGTGLSFTGSRGYAKQATNALCPTTMLSSSPAGRSLR